MNVKELAKEYKNQADELQEKIDKCRDKLKTATGDDLYALKKKIHTYDNMRFECMMTYDELEHYYDKSN